MRKTLIMLPSHCRAGIGIYTAADWAEEHFYMLPPVSIPDCPPPVPHINVNYRFNDWGTLEWSDLDTDTVRVGAAFRFTL